MGRLHNDVSQRFTKWANSFREGAVADITTRLATKREDRMAEEKRKETEAMERAAAGASTATALTLSVYIDAETDANYDFIYGEGTSAGWAEQRRKQAEEQRRAMEEYTAWAAAHPEEAAAKRKEEQAARRREHEKRMARRTGPGSRGGSSHATMDWSAWNAGKEAGASIGLDPQAEAPARGGLLR